MAGKRGLQVNDEEATARLRELAESLLSRDPAEDAAEPDLASLPSPREVLRRVKDAEYRDYFEAAVKEGAADTGYAWTLTVDGMVPHGGSQRGGCSAGIGSDKSDVRLRLRRRTRQASGSDLCQSRMPYTRIDPHD
jgi:hypothetical protein